MKKLFILALTVFTLNSYAQSLPDLIVSNGHGQYKDNSGEINIEKIDLTYNKLNYLQTDSTLLFSKDENILKLQNTNTIIKLSYNLNFLNAFTHTAFEDFSLSILKGQFKLDVGKLDYQLDKKNYRLKEIEITKLDLSVPKRTIIDAFIVSSQLKIKKINFWNISSQFFKDLALENDVKEKGFLEGIAAKVPFYLRQFKVHVKSGKFIAKGVVDSYLNLWLRIGGELKTDKENTFLEIHMKYAKLGYFSVKGTILKMARRIQSDNVKVSGSKITILF